MTSPYRASTAAALVVRPALPPSRPVVRIGLVVGGAACVLAFPFLGMTLATIGATAGCIGLVGLVARNWSRANDAADRLAALPFVVVHDRLAALAYGAPHRIESLSVRAREPVDLVLPSRPRTLHELADLMTTWGVAVHERHGITEVRVRWSQVGGPPPSL